MYRHRSFLLSLVAILLSLPATARGGGIDDPAYWADARAELASMGEGFIAWETNREGPWRIYGTALAGGPPRRLSAEEGKRIHQCPHLSPDGRHLAYLSLPPGSSTYSGKIKGKIQLRLLHLPSGRDRVVLEDVGWTTGGNRAVTWIDADSFYYIDAEGKARRYDISTGRSSQPVLTNGKRHLPNPTGTYASERHVYRPMDLKARKIQKTGKRFGGCEPYFTQDGRWGIRMNGAGGPADRVDLATGRTETILAKKDPRLPSSRRYIYFPMVSPCQRLLAWGASNNQHDHFKSDYDIFVAPIDPETLMLTGQVVRISFHGKVDRYPTVWLGDLDLAEQRGEAPLTVRWQHKQIRGSGWSWDYGDGRGGSAGQHTYKEPGTYKIRARRGKTVLKGRVVVAPAQPPKLLSAWLAGPRQLRVAFDEPIDATKARLELASGTAVGEIRTADRMILATLAAVPSNPDRLTLRGVRDCSQARHAMAPVEVEIRRAVWPVVREGLVFLFDTGEQPNVVADGKQRFSCRLQPRGRARLDRHHALLVSGGAFLADQQTDARLLETLKGSKQLTIEAVITTDSADQSGPARIVSFSRDAGSRNFTLGQQNGKLVLRLRTPRTGSNGTRPSAELFAIAPDRAIHVVVTYDDGRLRAYRDGKLEMETRKIRGDFSNWQAHHLVLGDEHSGQRNWDGRLEGVAIYNRALGPKQVEAHYRAFQAKQARRKDVHVLRVRAKVTATSQIPTIEQIAPYRRGLVVHEYAVVKHLSGPAVRPGQKIRVVEWALLDGQAQAAARRKPGRERQLLLEPFDAQSQLEALYVSDTLPVDAEVPYWFAVR